jgi:hypothetical protein
MVSRVKSAAPQLSSYQLHSSRLGGTRASNIIRCMTARTSGRRSIRFAVVATLCLLLGGATTVGVAWCVAIYPTASSMRRSVGYGSGWPAKVPADWPQLTYRVYGASWGSDWALVSDVLPSQHLLGISHHLVVLRFGWPLRALESQERSGDPAMPRAGSGSWRWTSWRIGAVRAGSRLPPWKTPRLPLLPLFPGFALNTTLYASAWYLLLFTPLPLYRAGRRRFRVSRGMCPACAYDLKGSRSGPCPECGTIAGVKA